MSYHSYRPRLRAQGCLSPRESGIELPAPRNELIHYPTGIDKSTPAYFYIHLSSRRHHARRRKERPLPCKPKLQANKPRTPSNRKAPSHHQTRRNRQLPADVALAVGSETATDDDDVGDVEPRFCSAVMSALTAALPVRFWLWISATQRSRQFPLHSGATSTTRVSGGG